MFFAGLIRTYIVLRFDAPPESWPHPRDVHQEDWNGANNTFELICPSVTIGPEARPDEHGGAAEAARRLAMSGELVAALDALKDRVAMRFHDSHDRQAAMEQLAYQVNKPHESEAQTRTRRETFLKAADDL